MVTLGHPSFVYFNRCEFRQTAKVYRSSWKIRPSVEQWVAHRDQKDSKKVELLLPLFPSFFLLFLLKYFFVSVFAYVYRLNFFFPFSSFSHLLTFSLFFPHFPTFHIFLLSCFCYFPDRLPFLPSFSFLLGFVPSPHHIHLLTYSCGSVADHQQQQ